MATPTDAPISTSHPVEGDRLLEGPQQRGGRGARTRSSSEAPGSEDGELVAAQPRDGAGGADDGRRGGAPTSHEQVVALLVPEGVVDLP